MAVTKRVPMRKCIGCGEMRAKQDMVRVIKTTKDEIALDETGRKNGRGAYLCPCKSCLMQAKKNRGLERSLQCAIPSELYEQMQEELQNIETR